MSEQGLVEQRAEGKRAQIKASCLEKYLTFNLAQVVYALEILSVKEIIGLMRITRIPRTPAYVRGIINLRGQVIPVVDLRVKFGIEPIEDTESSCIIVVQLADREKDITAGVLVDSVAEVLDMDGNCIEDTPTFGAGIETDFIQGIGKTGDRVVIILDIEKTIDFHELLDAVS